MDDRPTPPQPGRHPELVSDRDLPGWLNLAVDVVLMFNPFRLNRMLNAEGVAGLRARLPFSVFAALVTVVFSAVPFTVLVLHAQVLSSDPGFRARAGWWAIIWLPLLGGGMVAALFAPLELLGWLSGYRWFRGARRGVAAPEAGRVVDEVRGRAEGLGFQVQRALPDPGFLAFRLTRTAAPAVFHGVEDFPLLVGCRFVPRDPVSGDVACLVRCRTLVLWDTGEAATCRALGEALLGEGPR